LWEELGARGGDEGDWEVKGTVMAVKIAAWVPKFERIAEETVKQRVILRMTGNYQTQSS
jgi:hypothetical protein